MNNKRSRLQMLMVLAGFVCLIAQSSMANPAYTPGVWKKINPSGVPFNGPCCGGTSFAQGIAIDPVNRSTLYLCVNNFDVANAGLYKSTDGGSNWARIGNLTTPLFQGATTIMDQPLRIRIDPNNSQHLYCGDGVRGQSGGFWISTDGGANFAQPSGWIATSQEIFINDVYDVAVDPTDFNHALVSFHAPWSWASGCGVNCGNAGVLETKDGGQTWLQHGPIDGWGYGHSVWFLNNSATWLLGTQGNGFWRTTDSGANWTKVHTDDIAHGGGQIYYTKTGVLYASCAKSVLRSTDNGAHWSSVGGAEFTTSIFGDGNYLYAHKAYAGANEPFSVSLESDGKNWSSLTSAGSFTNGPFEMALDPVNRILYSGNWGDGLIAMKLNNTATSIAQNALQLKSLKQTGAERTIMISGDNSARLSMQNKVDRTIDFYDVKGQLIRRASTDKNGVLIMGRNTIGQQALLARIR